MRPDELAVHFDHAATDDGFDIGVLSSLRLAVHFMAKESQGPVREPEPADT